MPRMKVQYHGREWTVVAEEDGMVTLSRPSVKALLFMGRYYIVPCRRQLKVRRSAVTNVLPIR